MNTDSVSTVSRNVQATRVGRWDQSNPRNWSVGELQQRLNSIGIKIPAASCKTIRKADLLSLWLANVSLWLANGAKEVPPRAVPPVVSMASGTGNNVEMIPQGEQNGIETCESTASTGFHQGFSQLRVFSATNIESASKRDNSNFRERARL
jgi:hypothetical protein